MIIFDYGKLTDRERKLYDKLSEAQRKTFEKNWINVEKQKQKTNQAKARLQKMAKAQSEKERKARTHHLIEVGAAVEEFIEITDIDGFREYIKQWKGAIQKTQKAAPIEEQEKAPEYTPTNEGFFSSL